jgi:predicted component of type VI protein secretion system
MTAEELIKIAKLINPELLATYPQAALEDAYVFLQALRKAEADQPSEPELKSKKDAELTAVGRLALYLEKNKDQSVYKIAKKLKITSGAIYKWFDGTTEPNSKSIAKVEAFLRDAGYYSFYR